MAVSDSRRRRVSSPPSGCKTPSDLLEKPLTPYRRKTPGSSLRHRAVSS